jgi:hypothetical protein
MVQIKQLTEQEYNVDLALCATLSHKEEIEYTKSMGMGHAKLVDSLHTDRKLALNDHNVGTIRREWRNVEIVIDGVSHSLITDGVVNDDIRKELPAFVSMVELTNEYEYVTPDAVRRNIESMIADKGVYVDRGRLDEIRYLAKLTNCVDVIEGKIKELLSKDKYLWSMDEDGSIFVGDEEVLTIDVDTSSFVRLLRITEDTYLLSLKVEDLDGTPSAYDESFYRPDIYEQVFKLTCSVGNWNLEQLV